MKSTMGSGTRDDAAVAEVFKDNKDKLPKWNPETMGRYVAFGNSVFERDCTFILSTQFNFKFEAVGCARSQVDEHASHHYSTAGLQPQLWT